MIAYAMILTATQLRSRIYEVLREIAATGEPAEVELKGHRYLISSAVPRHHRLANLRPHPDAVNGSLEDLADAPTWDAATWERSQV